MEPHPSDAYFALDRVLDVAIEMAPEDWDALRRQTRTMADRYGGADCLDHPPEDVFAWFPARVAVDGEALAQVGVRKKGGLGSMSEAKPALKVRFDKFVAAQRLGGVLQRLTLNNVLQDPSKINTCLAYHIFAAAGLPAPRCNFAAVTVNGEELGLYVHVESIKTAFLERHFADAQGHLYEGALSDFRPQFRRSFEKKTRADEADWSDIDAVIAALQDASPTGLDALAAAIDLDRFLTFWAVEVLIGHWDGYAGNRNNFYVYRAADADAPLTFIPWGADQAFHSQASPRSVVQAKGAIAHRLYRDDALRAAYVRRLRTLLDAVWREEELLARVEALAAIVQTHAAPAARAPAARDADRIRRFIRTQRTRILADLEPAPPAWPWPLPASADTCRPQRGAVDLAFETTWGTNRRRNPLAEGQVTFAHYHLDEQAMRFARTGAVAGAAGGALFGAAGLEAEIGWAATLRVLEASLGNADGLFDRKDYEAARAAGIRLPPWDVFLSMDANGAGAVDQDAYEAAVWADRATGETVAGAVMESALGVTRCRKRFRRCALLAIISRGADSAWDAFMVELPLLRVASGARIDLDLSNNRQQSWHVDRHGRRGAIAQGQLEFFEARAEPGAKITGRLRGLLFSAAGAAAALPKAGLVINEVAAQGAPRDWFELYNASAAPIPLADFAWADDLADPDRRVPFPAGAILAPGAYLQIQLDKNGWPGFALGRDEELGIWTADGRLVARVDWAEGQADAGTSFARVPDGTGVFQTVNPPTPGVANVGLVINEVAAQGAPRDWFELYNASAAPIPLADFAWADDLADPDRRVPFPAGAILAPGAYLQIQLDKNGWPGFALGRDEELGIWTADGRLVARVDWAEGQADAGTSFARVPDGTGVFQTVNRPTPGASNHVPAAAE